VRLGVAYLPVFWILQGAGLSAAIARLAGPSRQESAVPFGVTALIVVLTVWDAVHVGMPRAVVLDGPRSASGALIQDETLEIRRAR
jgi:hypothetical protein